jgi:nucleotide-binding universal stress UspA family protein
METVIMENKAKMKILLTIDGSKRGLLTVKDIAGFMPFKNTQIKLFHVFNCVPASYWDLEREPKSVKSVIQVRAWESQQRKTIEKYMKKAKQLFVSQGFDDEQVTVDVQYRKKGVARDIIKEAKSGYDMVVARRRGLGMIPGITMGGVAVKLIGNLSFTPIFISGRSKPNSNILIGLDGSENSKRAVDFVGRLQDGHPVSIGLIHVLRSRKGDLSDSDQLFTPKGFVERTEIGVDKMMNDFRDRLIALNCMPNQIKIYKTVRAYSRGAAIVEQAKQGNYHLIVLGRSGISKPGDFSMGSVTNKVIQLSKESSICVVP